MKHLFTLGIIISSIVIFNQNSLQAQTAHKAKVVTFNINGAVDTYVMCVNDSNDIGGYFYNGTTYKGFMYLAKQNDTLIIEYPGAVHTFIHGINNYKVAVGSYTATGANVDKKGFKYTRATNTYQDITSSWLTHDIVVARDINDSECIVGDHKAGTSHACFSMCGGNNGVFHYNYNPTYIGGINKMGTHVGFWIDGSNNNGVIRNAAGNWTSLNYPGATRTRLNGINDSAYIVGTFNLTRSFIYKNGSFKEIMKPGCTDFQIQDINNSGFVVGYYKNASNTTSGFYMPYCDILFRPDTNGWAFGNSRPNMWPYAWFSQFDYTFDPYIGGQAPFLRVPYNNGTLDTMPRKYFPDWPLFVNTLGEEQCYFNFFGFYFLKEGSFNKWNSIVTEWGGSCFGFTQSSFMAWDSIQRFRAKYPNVGPWNAVTNPRNLLYELPLNADNRKCINSIQIMQNQDDYLKVRASNYDNMTPNITLDTLKKLMLAEKRFLYGLVFRNQNGSGGHIVNPYKIEIDTLNPHIEYIYVYDNNQPGDTTRRVTVNKKTNRWNYHLSVNAGVPQNPWGGPNASKGLYIIWPADSFYRKMDIDSVKYVGIAQGQKSNYFKIYNSNQANISIDNNAQQSMGYLNNNTYNNIPFASPITNLNATNQPPHGYLLPDDVYQVVMKDFSSPLVNLSLELDNAVYNYSRGNALLSHNDKFLISSNGLKMINTDNIVKTTRVKTIAQAINEEKTFTLSEFPLLINADIEFMLLNNDELKVVNNGGATHYNLEIKYLSASNVGTFTFDSIPFTAHTTHIISVNWPNLQNDDLMIFIDNNNNGTNDDTLYFNNQGVPIIITNPTLINHINTSYTDTIFIGNMGAGSMNWTVSSNAPWLSIQGNNVGSGFGFIKYNMTANTGAERSGQLTINVPNASNSPYIIDVHQEGIINAPANLVASDGSLSNGVEITWDPLSGATHYMVYRSETAGSNGTAISAWISSTSYIDNTASAGVYYYYSVKAAQNSSGLNESGFSNIDEGYRQCFTADFIYSGTCLGQPTAFTNMSATQSTAYLLWDIDNNGVIDYTGQFITHTFTTSGAKTISLTVTDSSLCTHTIQKTVNILPFPIVSLPSDTIVCAHQSITLNAGTGFSNYLWSNGTTSATTTIDTTGFGLGCLPIYVSVTSTNGCTTIDTTLITFTVCTQAPVHLNNADFDWQVYPNPANNNVNIVFEGNIETLQMMMYNFKGQLVYKERIENILGSHIQTIDIQHMPQGMYFIRCISEGVVKVKKLIVY